MKRKHYIQPTWTRQHFVRTGFTFDCPSNANERRPKRAWLWLRTIDSCRRKRNVDELGGAFRVFKPVSQRP
jgi:hypothetical protein